MINIIPIIIIFVMIIFIKLFKIPLELEVILIGLLMSSSCFYISNNIENSLLSIIFLVIGVIFIILIPILEVFVYLKKI